MNYRLPSSLLALALCAASLQAQTPARDPYANPPKSQGTSGGEKTGNLMYRVRMFALPVAEANEILSSPNLKLEPASVLRTLQRMVAEKKARVVANPVVVGKPGTRLTSEGAFRLEIDPLLEPDGRTVTFMMALSHQGGGNLRYDSKVAIGSAEFAGTLELPPSPRVPAGTELCLVFFAVQ